MTDLHVFGLRDGYRKEWERRRKIRLGNNRGLVLMKSWDLIHWNRAIFVSDKLSAGLGEIGCVWAPEVAYDDKKGEADDLLHHAFSRARPNKLYYVYVNDDFNR